MTKRVITARGVDGGAAGWIVTATSWRDWNAAAFIGSTSRVVVMLSAGPWVHACIAITGRWGYRSVAVGAGDIAGAESAGEGRERRFGPIVVTRWDAA